MIRWRTFGPAQLSVLATGPRFRDVRAERTCPVCGATAVRTYFQGGERLGNPILMTYTWCANCHRYHGATGPKPAGLEFDDPFGRLPALERSELGQDLISLLTYLDRLWDEGVLPQQISTR